MGIAKFEIRRKCKVCGECFSAKTVESWHCSPRCSKIAYKRRKDEEARQLKLDRIARKIPKSKEYIKVSEAYALFGISKDTLLQAYPQRAYFLCECWSKDDSGKQRGTHEDVPSPQASSKRQKARTETLLLGAKGLLYYQ